MPIHLIRETRDAIGANADLCKNRSLYFDRFADPTLKEDGRKKWFERGIGISVPVEAQRDRSTCLPGATFLHARLMSRLMVNMAGGVMENASLSLDRYGLPIIPGSAVKGCARRMALQALHDWIAAGTERPAPDDACAPCCEGFTAPAAMLTAIARIFGWTPEDWKIDQKNGHWKSDFAWAVAGDEAILGPTQELLPKHTTFAGTIAYLPASPNRDPGLEMDVVTPHHTDYYSEKKDNNGRLVMPVALDTEDPVPVFFPVVKAQAEGNYFTFPLIPLRLSQAGDDLHAKRWLANGLELLGIGAKTNAGYGWFEVPELAAQHQVWQEKKAAATAEREAVRILQEEAELALQNAPLLAIQPDQARLDHFATLKPDQLRACINKFQFEDKYWPKPPADEASDSYQVSLFIYLTETNRSLYDEEKSKPKSKVLLALQKLAIKYARKLPL